MLRTNQAEKALDLMRPTAHQCAPHNLPGTLHQWLSTHRHAVLAAPVVGLRGAGVARHAPGHGVAGARVGCTHAAARPAVDARSRAVQAALYHLLPARYRRAQRSMLLNQQGMGNATLSAFTMSLSTLAGRCEEPPEGQKTSCSNCRKHGVENKSLMLCCAASSPVQQ